MGLEVISRGRQDVRCRQSTKGRGGEKRGRGDTRNGQEFNGPEPFGVEIGDPYGEKKIVGRGKSVSVRIEIGSRGEKRLGGSPKSCNAQQ